MKVSLISGVMLAKDAISASTYRKAVALKEMSEADEGGIEVKVYVHESDYSLDGAVQIVSSVNDIVLDRHFVESQLIIYDFGIYNELFDSIHLAGSRAKKVVHFHSITPAAFVPEREHDIIGRSFEQLVNVLEADIVLVGSPYNRATLLEYGIEAARVSYLNYVVDCTCDKPRRSRNLESPVELLFVGRFVPSKGVIDLVEAFGAVLRAGISARLTLVGSLRFSNQEYLESVRVRIRQLGLSQGIDLVGEVSDEELNQYYRWANALVMPSYHEGFCVPVIEALCHGCNIISYDAGNLRYVANGLGVTVPTGNRSMLAEQLVRYACRLCENRQPEENGIIETDSGSMTVTEFDRAARSYVDDFSYGSFRRRLAAVLSPVASSKTREPKLRRSPNAFNIATQQ